MLNPFENYVQKLSVKDLKMLLEELSTYLKLFDAVCADYPLYQMNIEDVNYLNEHYPEAGRIYDELCKAVNKLRAVLDAFATTSSSQKNSQSFDIDFRSETYQYLTVNFRKSLAIILSILDRKA